MTLGQLRYVFGLNTQILMIEWKGQDEKGRDFRKHCEKIMQFPSHLVAEARERSIAKNGDKPPLFHIKAVFEILWELEKREHQKPLTSNAKEALSSWAKSIIA